MILAIYTIYKRRVKSLKEKKEWTKDELVEAILNFEEAMKFVKDSEPIWLNNMSECDKALSDIYHYCESDNIKSSHVKTVICNDLTKYGNKRRHYKDLINLFKPLYDYSGPIFCSKFFNACNWVKNKNNILKKNDSIYTFKVLKNYINMNKTNKQYDINNLSYDKNTITNIIDTVILLYIICSDDSHNASIYVYNNNEIKENIKASMKYIDNF